MPWTDQDEAGLQELYRQRDAMSGTQAPAEGVHGLARWGLNAFNALSGIGEGIVNIPADLLNLAASPGSKLPRIEAHDPMFDPGPSSGFADTASDFAGGAAKTVGQFLATKRLLKPIGITGAAASPTTGFIMGSPEGLPSAALSAAEFAGLGAAAGLPLFKRIAANTAIPVAGQLIRGQNPTDMGSAIGTAAQVILGELGARGERPVYQPNTNAADLLNARARLLRTAPETTVSPSLFSEMAAATEGEATLASNVAPLPRKLFRPIDYAEPLADKMPEPPKIIPGEPLSTAEPSGLQSAKAQETSLEARSAVEPTLMRRKSASESGSVGGTGFRPDPQLSDFQQYQAIQERMATMMRDRSAFNPRGEMTPEFIELWQNSENIKNRNGGMPPKEGPFVPRDRSTEGAASFPLMAHLGSGAAGAAAGYAQGDTDEERIRNAALGFAGGLVAPSVGRTLFRGLKRAGGAVERSAGLSGESGESGVVMSKAGKNLLRKVAPNLEPKLEAAAREQERNRPSFLGGATRFAERNITSAQPTVQTAQELGKGFQHDLSERATLATKNLAPIFNKADPKDLASIEAFNASKGTGASWSPAEESRLRSAIGDSAAESVMELRRVEEQAQQTLSASAKPKREQLIQDTLGTYDTRAFRAFLSPDKWQKDLAANPAKRDAAVNAFAAHPSFKGMHIEDIQQAVDEYGANIARKAKGQAPTNQARSQKIDQFLFTHRKELSPEVLDYLGEVKNPIEKRVLTVAKLLRSSAQAKTIRELLNSTDEAGNKLAMTVEERRTAIDDAVAKGDLQRANELRGYQQIEDVEGFGKMAGMMAPREVIDALNTHREVMSAGYDKMLSTVNNVLKQSLTVANPATHIRNWAQILTQGLIARVYNPVRYVEAVKVLRDKRDTWRKMVRLNIAGADYTSAELHSSAADLEEFLNPSGNRILRGAKSAGRAAQKLYGLPDNVTRIAAYLENEPRFIAEGQAKGLTGAALNDYAEKATQRFVNRYTWNYGAVSPLVKNLRNKPFINPFISYTAEMGRILKNLGEDVLTGDAKTKAWAVANLSQLLALPAILAAAGEQQLSEKDQKDWQVVDKLGPSYLRSQIKMPTGRNKDGTFRYLNLSPLVSAGDFYSVAKSLAKGDWSAIMGNNPLVGIDKTPALNLAATLINREDRFTGQKIKDAGDVASVLSSSVLPPFAGYQGKRLLRALTPNDEGGLGLVDQRTGREDTPSRVIPNLLGVPVSSVNPRALFRRAQMDASEELQDAKSELRKVLSTNAAPSVKEKAISLFRKKAQAIQEEQRRLFESVR